MRLSASNQKIILEDRSNLVISGVEQVDSFNENTIILTTIKGGLSVKGEGLNVSKVNLDEGNVRITGIINSISYNNKEGAPKNLMGRIFK
ncbi:sporulation protein YabP [Tissierella creatinini]|nr:sporulation protein YabP [Tissierella creatinini]TJX63733.1 sporulation protein YabP [Soehngenia saccharolytica]